MSFVSFEVNCYFLFACVIEAFGADGEVVRLRLGLVRAEEPAQIVLYLVRPLF